MYGEVNKLQDIKEQDICWNKYQSETTIFLWDQSCFQQDISKSDTITNEYLCYLIGCLFQYGNRQQQKCEDIILKYFLYLFSNKFLSLGKHKYVNGHDKDVRCNRNSFIYQFYLYIGFYRIQLFRQYRWNISLGLINLNLLRMFWRSFILEYFFQNIFVQRGLTIVSKRKY